jgi:prevent-host-death family protein
MTTIGAYDAKTHLPRLLDEVEAGGTVTITRHGREVARLVPVAPGGGTVGDVVAALRTARKGVRLEGLSIAELIREGRS